MDTKQYYGMHLQWSSEDQAYIVTVPELPGCRTYGDTYEAAIQHGQDAIESWLIKAEELGRPIPALKHGPCKARI